MVEHDSSPLEGSARTVKNETAGDRRSCPPCCARHGTRPTCGSGTWDRPLLTFMVRRRSPFESGRGLEIPAISDRRSSAIVSVDRTRAVDAAVGCAVGAMSAPPAKWKRPSSSIVRCISSALPPLSKLRARYPPLTASGSPMTSIPRTGCSPTVTSTRSPCEDRGGALRQPMSAPLTSLTRGSRGAALYLVVNGKLRSRELTGVEDRDSFGLSSISSTRLKRSR